MLICNNCFHENEDGVTQCAHCRMTGNFTYSENGERISDERREEEERDECLNCGSITPGDAERCVHCRFPLTNKRSETNPTSTQISKLDDHVQKKKPTI